MKNSYFFLFFIFFTLQVNAQVQIGSTSVQVDTIYENLDTPWEIKWGPGNQLWLTEKDGYVSRIDPQTGIRTVLLDISSEVEVQGESGLLGMAFSQTVTQFPDVFLVYTYLDGGDIKEKVVRYNYNGTQLLNELVLIDNIPANNFHNGSRLLMLDDNTLLMTTGDAGNTSLSQNMNSLAGKILRFHQDGTIPSDNPFSGSYIYSLGHRNPQGLFKHPNGKIYSSEHGPSNDDEFQIILSGRNYGWPNVEGFCDSPSENTFCNDSNVVEPLFAWSPTIAPSDLVYYENPGLPEFHQKILMTVLKDQMIVAFEMAADGESVVSEENYLENQFGRIRDICIGSENEIYILANNNSGNQQIVVLRPANLAGLEKNNNISFQIFPNPAQDEITIVSNISFDHIEILDQGGRVVSVHKSTTENKVDIRQLTPGKYTLRIIDQDSNVSATQNFIKR